MPVISIHALREEGDAWSMTSSTSTSNFYPRPPRGGRPPNIGQFESIEQISIHALREEGDDVPTVGQVLSDYFYPRPPRGGRPVTLSVMSEVRDFYPRPPRGGRLCLSR